MAKKKPYRAPKDHVGLRHVTFTTSGTVFLPEGRALRSESGLLEVPLSRPLAVLAAWYDGYRIDEETGEEIRSVEAFLREHQPEPEPKPETSPDKE